MAPSTPRLLGAPRGGSAYLSTPGRPLLPRLPLGGLCGEARGSAATLCALGSPFRPPVREGELSRKRKSPRLISGGKSRTPRPHNLAGKGLHSRPLPTLREGLHARPLPTCWGRAYTPVPYQPCGRAYTPVPNPSPVFTPAFAGSALLGVRLPDAPSIAGGRLSMQWACGALVATHPPIRPGAASEASGIPWGVPSPVDPFGLRRGLRSFTPRWFRYSRFPGRPPSRLSGEGPEARPSP